VEAGGGSGGFRQGGVGFSRQRKKSGLRWEVFEGDFAVTRRRTGVDTGAGAGLCAHLELKC